MTFPPWDAVALVTIALFVVGLIYDAGRKAEQLRGLMQARDEDRKQLTGVVTGIAELRGLLIGKQSHGEHD